MKKFTSFILLFILLSGSAKALIYQNGYIITLKRDTVFGQIAYQSEKLNAKECIFKPNKNADRKIYQPSEIYGYRYADIGRYYVSREIVINETKRTVFLEYLLYGEVDLFYYAGEKNYYLFENKEGDSKLICQDNKINVTIGTRQFEKTDYTYVRTIMGIFKNCPQLSSEVQKSALEHHSLIKLTKKYHDLTCKDGGSCLIFQQKLPPIKFNLRNYFYYGQMSPSLVLPLPFFELINSSVFIPSLEGEFIFPRITPQLSLVGSINYSQSENYQYIDLITSESVTLRSIHYATKQVMLNFGLKYTLSFSKFKPKFKAGISLNNQFEKTLKYETEGRVIGSYNYKLLDWTDMLETDQIGWFAEAGAEYQLNHRNDIGLSIRMQNYQQNKYIMAGLSFKW